jgi:hypothetical protein
MAVEVVVRMEDEMVEDMEGGQDPHTVLYAAKTLVITPEIAGTVEWLEN